MKKIFILLFGVMMATLGHAKSSQKLKKPQGCNLDKNNLHLTLNHLYFSDDTIGLYNELNSASTHQKHSKLSVENNAEKVSSLKFKKKNIRVVNIEKSHDFLKDLFKSNCAIKLEQEDLFVVQNNLKSTDEEELKMLAEIMEHTTKTLEPNDSLLKIKYFLVMEFSIAGASGGYIVLPLEESAKLGKFEPHN